jgi:pimeloyl-ACP methyl ester carboxylesterase
MSAHTDIDSAKLVTDSHTTHYLTAGPEDGPVLVFVHGWPALADTWEPQLRAFAERGYRAVAPSLTQHGAIPAGAGSS